MTEVLVKRETDARDVCAGERPREKAALCQPREASGETCWHVDLGLLASRIVSK